MAIDLNRIAALKSKLAAAQKVVADKISAHVEASLEGAAVTAYEKALSVGEAVVSALISADSAPAPTAATAPKAEEPKKS